MTPKTHINLHNYKHEFNIPFNETSSQNVDEITASISMADLLTILRATKKVSTQQIVSEFIEKLKELNRGLLTLDVFTNILRDEADYVELANECNILSNAQFKAQVAKNEDIISEI